MSSQGLNNAVEKYKQFLEAIEEKIEANIAVGKNTPATGLAKEVGAAFGMEWQRAYQLINFYAEIRGLVSYKGPSGGLGLPKEGDKK